MGHVISVSDDAGGNEVFESVVLIFLSLPLRHIWGGSAGLCHSVEQIEAQMLARKLYLSMPSDTVEWESVVKFYEHGICAQDLCRAVSILSEPHEWHIWLYVVRHCSLSCIAKASIFYITPKHCYRLLHTCHVYRHCRFSPFYISYSDLDFGWSAQVSRK